YFCKRDWTGQIRLICFRKFAVRRMRRHHSGMPKCAGHARVCCSTTSRRLGDALDFESLPRLERQKLLARNLRFVERGVQRVERRIDGFVGQSKCAVMMRQSLRGLAIV